MLQPKLLIKVLALLNKNQIDYMITGSFASSIQGEPRATHDVDLLANISYTAIPALIKAFPPPDYYISQIAIEEAIQHKSMFNLLDAVEGNKERFFYRITNSIINSANSPSLPVENPGIKKDFFIVLLIQ